MYFGDGQRWKVCQWRQLLFALPLIALLFYVFNFSWPQHSFSSAKVALSASSQAANSGAYHYVSKQGNNQDGSSWASAWNEMDQIDWGVINPGDTILIDGGNSGMTYATSLDIARSGTSGNPIRIHAAGESGRNGKVTLFGGRYLPLPYCYQSGFQDQSDLQLFGIKTNDHSWIEIDGRDWQGLTVHGFERSGIRIDRNSKNVTIRNVEVYNNGYPKRTSLGTIPEGVGLRLGGENILLERAIIRDNGQDSIQSLWEDNNIRNFRMNESWLYNSRRHPNQEDSFNYCTHTDGIQIYDGGVIVGVTIENSVVGPGFTQGLILGQSRTNNGAWADVRNVVIRDTVVAKSTDNAIYGYRDTGSYNWHLERVTLDCEMTKGHCIFLKNRDHTVSESVIYKGRVTFDDGLNHYYRNCVWENKGLILGLNADPQFASFSSYRLSRDDYAVSDSSACAGAGSRITSGAQLINNRQEQAAPAPTSTPAATATPVATSTLVPTATPGATSTPGATATLGATATPAATSTPAPTSTPMPTATPVVPFQGSGNEECGGLVQEAESGELNGNFIVGYDGAASNGQFVYVEDGHGNRGVSPDSTQRVRYCFNVLSAGTYRIKGWVYAADLYNNSFYLQIGDNPNNGYIWHNRVNVGYGAEYATANNGYEHIGIYLNPGFQTVDLLLREDGTRLDRVALELVPEAGSADFQNGSPESRFANSGQMQWLAGTINALEAENPLVNRPSGMGSSGSELFQNSGLALVDAATGGELARLELNVDANGNYYVDAVPAGRYRLSLPLGFAFSGEVSPEIEVSDGEVMEHRFEFVYSRQQLFLPFVQ